MESRDEKIGIKSVENKVYIKYIEKFNQKRVEGENGSVVWWLEHISSFE